MLSTKCEREQFPTSHRTGSRLQVITKPDLYLKPQGRRDIHSQASSRHFKVEILQGFYRQYERSNQIGKLSAFRTEPTIKNGTIRIDSSKQKAPSLFSSEMPVAMYQKLRKQLYCRGVINRSDATILSTYAMEA